MILLTGSRPFFGLVPNVQSAKLEKGIASDLGRRAGTQHDLWQAINDAIKARDGTAYIPSLWHCIVTINTCQRWDCRNRPLYSAVRLGAFIKATASEMTLLPDLSLPFSTIQSHGRRGMPFLDPT